MGSKALQNNPLGAFCNTFDLHYAIIGLENHFFVFLRVAVLHRFYCNCGQNDLIIVHTVFSPCDSVGGALDWGLKVC